MSDKRPNDEIFNGASQTRTANEIADGKMGKYSPTPAPTPGNTPPPGVRQPPFQIKGS